MHTSQTPSIHQDYVLLHTNSPGLSVFKLQCSTPSSSSPNIASILTCFPICSSPAVQKWAEVHRVKLCMRSPLCLGKKKKCTLIVFTFPDKLRCVKSRHGYCQKIGGRVGRLFSVRWSAAQVLGRLRDAPQHTCWSCEQSWQRLRSALAAAAQMQCNFGVESSVNISFCCACSAFIWLLMPRASVFPCSSGGLHSVQPPPHHLHH